jgi:hypothetical protein
VEKIKANNMSLSLRRPVCGVGTNDSWYITSPTINGKVTTCPAYLKWKGMLMRCYDKIFLEKYPSYVGCTVCKEWLLFSNFENWFSSRVIEGYHLDKDIKIKGNKVYSPEACLFVPACINSLLTDSKAIRGKYPPGVSFNKPMNKIVASVKVDGKSKHIGYFNSVSDASNAYADRKNKEIKRKCEEYPALASYLMHHLIKTEK